MNPEIILNCAASADGKIALANRQKLNLSNKEDFKRVHSLRSDCDAIIVGIGTVLEDNPSLTINTKYASGKDPIRIILDTNCRTPKDAKVLDGKSKTIIAIGNKSKEKKLQNAEILRCGNKEINLEKLIGKMGKRGIKRIIVEGGETVLWSFLRNKLFDELNIFISNVIIGNKSKEKKLQNAEILRCGNKEINLEKLIGKMGEIGVKKIIVEGGETVLWSFLRNKLFDELNIFISNVIIGGSNTPTIAGGDGFLNENELLELKLNNIEKMGSGFLVKYTKSNN